MIPLQYYTRGDLTREEIDALWDAGVCMDDWDYVVMLPAEALITEETEDWDGEPTITFCPRDWYIERMVSGCSYTRWYCIEWKGEPRGVGVAYHA